MGMNEESLRILVIDDDAEVRYSLNRVLTGEGYQVVEAASGEEGIEAAGECKPSVVLTDNRMGGMSGVEALQHLRAVVPDAMVVIMTAFGTSQTAIEAMKFGAFDYVVKPFDPKRLLEIVGKAAAAWKHLGEASYEPALKREDYAEGIVGSSEPMQQVLKQIGQVTASEVTVLITGESGTGKELVARCICRHSHRSSKPFIAVNCAAIPENLIESELFGHEKGSFTGAVGQRQGKFELCDRGTIFLDEIGDMALPTQTKILRVLQEGEIQRVGSTETIQVDVRIVAATNKDIEALVKQGRFREDLYYRLNVFRIRIPSLRERPSDIPEIVDFHLQRLAQQKRIKKRKISRAALEVLMNHSWPGNVRELENTVYRSAVVAQGETILSTDLPSEVVDSVGKHRAIKLGADPDTGEEASPAPALPRWEEEGPEGAEAAASVAPNMEAHLDAVFSKMVEEAPSGKMLPMLEEAMIRRAMERTEGNQTAAAGLLGIGRAALRKRLDQLKAL